jgi:RNA polymerase sigma factor (sigma-70 family)
MNEPQLVPHLFRTEFSKISTVLCKYLGVDKLEVAEDIASETFLLALETWPYKGTPPNPTAWLYKVARNKTFIYLQRSKVFKEKIVTDLQSQTDQSFEIDLSIENINDSTLRMLFIVCHPSIPEESQIALALRILCGFGVDEIATAFLTNHDTIHKRLQRGRQKLKDEKIEFELPSSAEIEKRLDTVLTTLYLLFSEGYYSENNAEIVRDELCREAMRLTFVLISDKITCSPKVQALYALMCFHASRLAARRDEQEEIVLYDQQDVSRWNQELISQGAFYLNAASQGDLLSKYHLEAAIAYWHTRKEDTHEKWENILQLYNRLLQTEYSPIAALNRTYALYKANGRDEALQEAEKLQLINNHFYFLLLGELYVDVDQQKALTNFNKALGLAKSDADKRQIEKKIRMLQK